MALANATLITVTGTYTRLDGRPAKGQVFFSSNQVLVDSSSGEIVPPVDFVATLDANGAISIDLPATDDTDYEPTGWVYTVTEDTDGGDRPPYGLSVPADGGTIDLADVAPPGPTESLSSDEYTLLSTFTSHRSNADEHIGEGLLSTPAVGDVLRHEGTDGWQVYRGSSAGEALVWDGSAWVHDSDTYREAHREFIDVSHPDYGAVGGDTTADTQAFKDAIADARTGNLPLYVPRLSSAYWIGEALPDVDWEAGVIADPGAELKAQAAIAYILRSAAIASRFFGLTLNGNSNATDCMSFIDSGRSVVELLDVTGATNDGVNIDGSAGGNNNLMRFTDCRSRLNGRAGFGVEVATENNGILWSNCHANDNEYGLLGRGQGGRIEFGNYFNNTTSGVQLGLGADTNFTTSYFLFYPWLEMNGAAESDGVHYGKATRTICILDNAVQGTDLANQGNGRNFVMVATSSGLAFHSGQDAPDGALEVNGPILRTAGGSSQDLYLDANNRVVLQAPVWHTSSQIGFYGTLPKAQPTAPASLTDNSGGTTDDTVEAVSGSGADAAINNNFAEVAEELNQIRSALANIGLWA